MTFARVLAVNSEGGSQTLELKWRGGIGIRKFSFSDTWLGRGGNEVSVRGRGCRERFFGYVKSLSFWAE